MIRFVRVDVLFDVPISRQHPDGKFDPPLWFNHKIGKLTKPTEDLKDAERRGVRFPNHIPELVAIDSIYMTPVTEIEYMIQLLED